MKLSEEQQEVIDNRAATRIVVAGPGSGKTRVLAAAVADDARRIGPEKCLVLTYTNAAADEMESRLALEGIKDVGFIGTLHAFCLKLLNQHAALIGLPTPLTVADDEQKEPLVQSIMETMGSKASLKKVMMLLTPHHFVNPPSGQSWSKEQLVAIEYYRTLKRGGLLDFDMVLHFALSLLLTHTFSWPFESLFVDEVQDSAVEDWRIYDAMPCKRKLFVGDPDQAIYGFRGGVVGELVGRANLLYHPHTSKFKSSAVFTLSDNYRCGHEICLLANRVIRNNRNRVEKETVSVAPFEYGSSGINVCASPIAELAMVADGIQSLAAPAQCAVLARTNARAREFAEFLKARGIPVQERKWKEEPEDWRLAKLALTLLANPYNDTAAHAYLSAKYNTEVANNVRRRAAKEMKSMLGDDPQFKRGVNPFMLDGLSAESRERIHDACRKLSARGEWTVSELIAFLNSGEEMRETEGEGVYVGTIHSAKGREWETVFIVECEEGELPSGRKDTDVEEERRLMFVGITRAKRRLFISHCEHRPQNRGPNISPGPMQPRQPSRFIAEFALVRMPDRHPS